MAATLHPLVTASDYKLLEDGTFTLPETDDYLLLEGAFCDDPVKGAEDYNRSLIRYIKRRTANNFGEPRYQRIFNQYANNRRIQKVIALALTARDKRISGKPLHHKEADIKVPLTSLESILFMHLPIKYLQD